MDCNAFQNYLLGKLEESRFQRHLRKCPECRRQLAQDRKIFATARKWNQPLRFPGLWPKIELRLLEEQKRRKGTRERIFPLLRSAALVIILLAIGYFFGSPDTPQNSKFLTKSALKKVEKKEQEYEKAINQLEQLVLPKLSQLNLELMFLYRDQLETINWQIARCKEELQRNPANAHIRRYLFMALQDKKNTLKELSQLEQSNL